MLVFCLLTTFISGPISAYLALMQKDIMPYDRAINTTALAFNLAELIAGIYAVRVCIGLFVQEEAMHCPH